MEIGEGGIVVNGEKFEKPIGGSDVLKSAGVAVIPFAVLVIAAVEQRSGPGYPIVYSVLLVALVTFGYRASWLFCRRRTHVLVSNVKSFAPERFAYLGLVIAAVMVAIAFITGQTKVSSTSNMTQWMAGLVTTVPLLEVFGGSWGQLQARPISSDEDGKVADRGSDKRIRSDCLPCRSKNEAEKSKSIETCMR